MKFILPYQGQEGLEFDIKEHILHNYVISTPHKENPSNSFKDSHKLKLQTKSDVNRASFLGGVMNDVFKIMCVKFVISDDEVRLTSKFVLSFSLLRFLK